MLYSFRQARTEDLALLDKIHTDNMQSYVEKAYSWKPTLFADNFIAQQYQVIESNKEVIGFIKIVTTDIDVYLAEIQISGSYQNRGVGSSVINNLIDRVKANRQRLWLKSLQTNPAINLYQRLGFTVFETTATHVKLELNS